LLHRITQSKEYDPSKLMKRTEVIGIQITEITAQIAEDTAEKARKREERLQDLSMQIQELSVEIASYAIQDSGTMRGIGWVTMAFLPATFVTSFFGMNFFNGVKGVQAFDKTSRNVWIFFLLLYRLLLLCCLCLGDGIASRKLKCRIYLLGETVDAGCSWRMVGRRYYDEG
jgi:Mg2+ and Co2+ transporter CorA